MYVDFSQKGGGGKVGQNQGANTVIFREQIQKILNKNKGKHLKIKGIPRVSALIAPWFNELAKSVKIVVNQATHGAPHG